MTMLTIAQLARAVDVNVQTVRFYERRGLLIPTQRRSSGYRLYNDEAVRRLRFIRNAQQLGFTLNEIAELLDLRVNSTARCGTVQTKAVAKLEQVQRKLTELQKLAGALGGLIQSCQLGEITGPCPILRNLERERSTKGDSRKTTR